MERPTSLSPRKLLSLPGITGLQVPPEVRRECGPEAQSDGRHGGAHPGPDLGFIPRAADGAHQ